MKGTPEPGSGASPFRLAEDGEPAEDTAGPSPRAGPRGAAALDGRANEPSARERPRPPARERPRPPSRERLWRVTVAETSMAPTLLPGDWLLLDPTTRRWPRRGAIVVFREPRSGMLAIKRVAARGGDRVLDRYGVVDLAPDEAWLLGDNRSVSVDSRRYGPVPDSALIGRAWLRYGPAGRFGRLG